MRKFEISPRFGTVAMLRSDKLGPMNSVRHVGFQAISPGGGRLLHCLGACSRLVQLLLQLEQLPELINIG